MIYLYLTFLMAGQLAHCRKRKEKKNALNVIIELLDSKFNIQSFTLTVPIHTTKVLYKDNLICVL